MNAHEVSSNMSLTGSPFFCLVFPTFFRHCLCSLVKKVP